MDFTQYKIKSLIPKRYVIAVGTPYKNYEFVQREEEDFEFENKLVFNPEDATVFYSEEEVKELILYFGRHKWKFKDGYFYALLEADFDGTLHGLNTFFDCDYKENDKGGRRYYLI